LRIRGLPLFTCLAAGAVVFFLWNRTWSPTNFIGEVQSPSALVSVRQDGALIELNVRQFDRVERGDVIGTLQIAGQDALGAALDAAKTDLEIMRLRLAQDQQRNNLNFESTRIDLAVQRMDLAIAKVRLRQAEGELERSEKLREQGILQTGVGWDNRLMGYEGALMNRDALREEVNERTQIVAELGEVLKRTETSDGAMGSATIADTIDRAIAAQEALLREQEGTTTLRAPIAGIVSKVLRGAGENVVAGETIVEIEGEEPSQIIGFIRQPINFTPQAGDSVVVKTRGVPRQTGTARILRVGGGLQLFIQPLRVRGFDSSQERGLPLMLSLPEGLTLYPGELVDLIPGVSGQSVTLK
jgi:multidrug resistance efflux pump